MTWRDATGDLEDHRPKLPKNIDRFTAMFNWTAEEDDFLDQQRALRLWISWVLEGSLENIEESSLTTGVDDFLDGLQIDIHIRFQKLVMLQKPADALLLEEIIRMTGFYKQSPDQKANA